MANPCTDASQGVFAKPIFAETTKEFERFITANLLVGELFAHFDGSRANCYPVSSLSLLNQFVLRKNLSPATNLDWDGARR
jgi:hypothetical protein